LSDSRCPESSMIPLHTGISDDCEFWHDSWMLPLHGGVQTDLKHLQSIRPPTGPVLTSTKRKDSMKKIMMLAAATAFSTGAMAGDMKSTMDGDSRAERMEQQSSS